MVLVFVGPPQARGVGASGTNQLNLGFLVEVRERVQASELTEVGRPVQRCRDVLASEASRMSQRRDLQVD